jgi:hypothetical protein
MGAPRSEGIPGPLPAGDSAPRLSAVGRPSAVGRLGPVGSLSALALPRRLPALRSLRGLTLAADHREPLG